MAVRKLSFQIFFWWPDDTVLMQVQGRLSLACFTHYRGAWRYPHWLEQSKWVFSIARTSKTWAPEKENILPSLVCHGTLWWPWEFMPCLCYWSFFPFGKKPEEHLLQIGGRCSSNNRSRLGYEHWVVYVATLNPQPHPKALALDELLVLKVYICTSKSIFQMDLDVSFEGSRKSPPHHIFTPYFDVTIDENDGNHLSS